MLEAKLFGEDQRDGYETSHGCQEMLGATEKDWVKTDTKLAVYFYQVVEGNLKVTHKCLGDTSVTHSSSFGSFNALLGAVPKHLQELQCTPSNFSHFPCPKTFLVLWTPQTTVRHNQFTPSTCRQSCRGDSSRKVGTSQGKGRERSGKVDASASVHLICTTKDNIKSWQIGATHSLLSVAFLKQCNYG